MFSLTPTRTIVQSAARRTAATWSGSLSFASPESDFASSSAREYSISAAAPMEVMVAPSRPTWSRTLSFASPESDFTSHHAAPPVQFPSSLAQAMASPLACVVTTTDAPNRIVCVNPAWEVLCGYEQKEVLHRTLGFLQGDATNTGLVQKTLSNVTADEWADMYVVNYKKDGSPFTNHVSIKAVPLTNEEGDDNQFLLGVLEPVEKSPLRMIF